MYACMIIMHALLAKSYGVPVSILHARYGTLARPNYVIHFDYVQNSTTAICLPAIVHLICKKSQKMALSKSAKILFSW